MSHPAVCKSPLEFLTHLSPNWMRLDQLASECFADNANVMQISLLTLRTDHAIKFERRGKGAKEEIRIAPSSWLLARAKAQQWWQENSEVAA